ncbi:hypothetical protein [Cereibacter sphaeroides]|uniref:hypothetical protein n=1 Tax=Cereibacter sphaeroides TaxID=1063 RepID=UPI000F533151|nr:hypothetical protein [Cereibacter sphaeroides]AZB70294.1 hypothetical protein EBL86_18075 [Cereibacter sphaeroides]
MEFLRDARFLDAAQKAIATIPDDIAEEISELTQISEENIDELIARHEKKLAEVQEKYGPQARLGEAPTRERAQRSLEFLRRDALDWVFFRRWRIDDGWLSTKEAEAALDIFHDRLAISMRRSVIRDLHPSKPQFLE